MFLEWHFHTILSLFFLFSRVLTEQQRHAYTHKGVSHERQASTRIGVGRRVSDPERLQAHEKEFGIVGDP